ncbi:MAG TPA: di-heme oxidoredictase family protein, partial [Candidatus Polarisedimenticolaceae bacterium]|nr:di-heme oxidoredictase family protein [Candidatus Polarisedimenticolaceae bacterium]
YLHDGRATTLTEAILAHGGEAEGARDGFASLTDSAKADVLIFLRTLRTPDDLEQSESIQNPGGRLARDRGTFVGRN